MHNVRISIDAGDVTAVAGDVLAVKHAQAFLGVARTVAADLRLSEGPAVGAHMLHPAPAAYGARELLLVGTPDLWTAGYTTIRDLARRVLAILAVERPGCRRLLTTIHGPGYGLDETEAFLAQIGGFVDALRDGTYPAALDAISVVEVDEARIERLRPVLAPYQEEFSSAMFSAFEAKKEPAVRGELAEPVRTAGVTSETKEHAFVAMPFRPELYDLFHYGIQQPVHAMGWLCERADLTAFTGDVLEHVKERIRTAKLVIADLTGANANVYLELGYAWGVNRPTVLLARHGSELLFDVRGQRCLMYDHIHEMEPRLAAELRQLERAGLL